MSIVLENGQLMTLLLVFWLPAQIAHLIGALIANHDDIIFEWKYFTLGDIGGYILVCLVTVLYVHVFSFSIYLLYGFYILYILILSTLFTDTALSQETMSVGDVGGIFKETLVESILIPWAAGFGVGIITVLIYFN